MNRRHVTAITLVELLIGFILGTLLLLVAYNFLYTLRFGQEKADDLSSGTIVQVQLTEALVMDLRSSIEVVEITAGSHYNISRHVKAASGMEVKLIEWRVVDQGRRVTRTAPGERTMTFDLDRILPPGAPYILRMETLQDDDFMGTRRTPTP